MDGAFTGAMASGVAGANTVIRPRASVVGVMAARRCVVLRSSYFRQWPDELR